MYALTCPATGCGQVLKRGMYVCFTSGYEDPANTLFSCVQHAAHLSNYTGSNINCWRNRDQTWYNYKFTREAWNAIFVHTRTVYEEMTKHKRDRKNNASAPKRKSKSNDPEKYKRIKVERNTPSASLEQ